MPLLAPMMFLADATSAAPEGGMLRTLTFFGVVLAFFYLILWRPEQKRRKKMQDLRNNLKPGDKVTAMGIIGEVHKIKEATIILKMFDGAKIEIIKGAISEIHQPAVEKATVETIEATS